MSHQMTEKKTVLLAFDNELLMDARKILFRNGLTLQQFITCVFHRLTLNDDAAIKLLEEASVYNQTILNQEDKEAVAKIDPASLYAIFEREDMKNNK